MMLRPAQSFRILARIDECPAPARPAQHAPRRLPARAGGATGGKNAALALHHHVAHFGGGGAHQSDPDSLLPRRDPIDPFGARAGLAEAAPRHDEPGPPVALGRKLRRPRMGLPRAAEPPRTEEHKATLPSQLRS